MEPTIIPDAAYEAIWNEIEAAEYMLELVGMNDWQTEGTEARRLWLESVSGECERHGFTIADLWAEVDRRYDAKYGAQ